MDQAAPEGEQDLPIALDCEAAAIVPGFLSIAHEDASAERPGSEDGVHAEGRIEVPRRSGSVTREREAESQSGEYRGLNLPAHHLRTPSRRKPVTTVRRGHLASLRSSRGAGRG